MEFAEKNVAFGSQITQNAQIKYDWDYFFSQKTGNSQKKICCTWLTDNTECTDKILLGLFLLAEKGGIRRKKYVALGSQIPQNAQIKYDWDYFFLVENGEFAEKNMLHLAHR